MAEADPFGYHYTPQELAKIWHLDESTVRRMFRDEPGVFRVIEHKGRRKKRDYVTLRIPAATAERFYRQRIAKC